MKKLVLLVSTTVIVMLLFGCQSEKEGMTVLGTINKLSISNSKGYGGINEQHIFSSNDIRITSNFEDVMKRSRLVKKEVLIGGPDYDILVEYKNKDNHLLHLILGNSDEMYLTYVGYEDTVYEILPDDRDSIRKRLSR